MTVVSVTNDPVILYDDPFDSVSVPDPHVTLLYPVDDQARLFTHPRIPHISPLFTSPTKDDNPVTDRIVCLSALSPGLLVNTGTNSDILMLSLYGFISYFGN